MRGMHFLMTERCLSWFRLQCSRNWRLKKEFEFNLKLVLKICLISVTGCIPAVDVRCLFPQAMEIVTGMLSGITAHYKSVLKPQYPHQSAGKI
ncbi:MAG: hypothetical protein EZS28_031727 [Streblomastix strix]|uniref:Uncharacterized protein n=1 Tax=Streblomastix strix TaxID=222440 RepID=A0A5J4UPY4_9EUKA|nr:MAG: hypothetical protein EZS28_031727 [Streblomastix strix]